ncbi:MAG: helix-turn-helix transcriptional regulator [Actinobacteria bacterium]|nr:helix-turn-helix transcriptional regulator [Actinomycetota bacterium]
MAEGNGTVALGGGGPADAELLVALRHVLRRKILRAMYLDEEATISPRRLAEVLKEPLSNVSYHVRILADCGAVELIDTEPVRGSMQHFYSPTVDEPWALAVLGLDPSGGEDSTPAARDL